VNFLMFSLTLWRISRKIVRISG